MHVKKYKNPGMIFLAILSSVVCSARTQYQSAFADQDGAAPYSAAPLHYVKIGSRLAGDYQFGYDTGKGPMGQSFREEVRLADGSVKGSYGSIDEFGQKRVFHYSSGKGASFSEQDTNKLTPSLPVRQREPKFLMEQNFNTFSKQFPIFKPANYLQSRAVSSLYAPANPEQTDYRLPSVKEALKPVAPISRLPNWTERDPLDTTTTPAPSYKSTAAPVQMPLQPVNIASPLYRPSASPPPRKVYATAVQVPPVNVAVPLYRTSTPTPKPTTTQSPFRPTNAALPLYRTSAAPASSQKSSPKSAQSDEVRRGEEEKSIATLTEIYNSQTRRRVTKKPSPPAKPQKKEKAKKRIVEQSYDARSEDDYYDSAPAFIDIERLSYNIGSDKSSASV